MLIARLSVQPHALTYITHGLQFLLKSLVAIDEL